MISDGVRTPGSDYRPDIDGLRAIAVMSVVGFHAFSFRFPGGFTGVDVFFVISGYLISGIIFHARSRGDFAYLAFYARRIRRLFPSLLVVLSASLGAGYWLLFSTEFSRMAGDIAAATVFVANFRFAREVAGYFDTSTALKPALHLWSLAVEEQFYLIWPPLAVLIIAMPRRLGGLAIAALGLLSFWSAVLLTAGQPVAAFYLPTTRAWELLLGALLALQAPARKNATAAAALVRGGMSFIGLGLIAFAALSHVTLTLPLWRSVAACVGTMLVIASGRTAWINRHLLSSRVVVFFGVISYPLYLWHWPILSFLRISLIDDLSRPVRVAAVLASIGLAWLTYRFVERPVRFGPRGQRNILILAGAAGAIGSCAFLIALQSRPRDARDAFVAGYENLWPDYGYGNSRDLFTAYREECNFFDMRTYRSRDGIDASCTTPASKTSVLLWGDSHAQQLAAGLKATLPRDISLLQVATSACEPSLDFGSGVVSACERSNKAAEETILGVHPDVVVLAQRADHLHTDWTRLAASIRLLGARAVILVGPAPRWAQDFPKVLARLHWPDLPEFESVGLVEETVATDRTLSRMYSSRAGFAYVSLVDLLCGPRGCRTFVGPDQSEDIVTFDTGHLTPSASRFVARHVLAPAVLKAIDKAGRQVAPVTETGSVGR